jgi:hypothetical protein
MIHLMCIQILSDDVELTAEVSKAPTTLAIELEITSDDEACLEARDMDGLGGDDDCT